ncbi:MAG TPA: hypothetical protein PL037_08165 [Elusimicrobiales bacterium]|nr:hypothetical protein [Elusimicrobiales bacterium]
MNHKKIPACVCAALIALPFLISGAEAQLRLDGINWEVSAVEGKRSMPYKPIQELRLEPYRKYTDKLRAIVSVKNEYSRPAEGLVLRYALSLHVVRTTVPADAGFWAVPFRTEELRISQIKAGGAYGARLIHFVLNEQLRKLNNTGFWVDALKLQVMLDPRSGEEPSRIIKEDVIAIVRPGTAVKR